MEEEGNFVKLIGERPAETTFVESVRPELSSDEKAKARDIVTAIRTLQLIEKEDRPATADEACPLLRLRAGGAFHLRQSCPASTRTTRGERSAKK